MATNTEKSPEAMSSLIDLKEGESAFISGFRQNQTADYDMTVMRLIELGIIVGEAVKVTQKSPFGGSPIVISVLGALIGLNGHEAGLVSVQRTLS